MAVGAKVDVPNELSAQPEQIFENLRVILETNGAVANVERIHTYFTTLDGLARAARCISDTCPLAPAGSAVAWRAQGTE